MAMATDLVEDVVVRLLKMAVTSLPSDVVDALRKAREEETSEVAKAQLDTIIQNIQLAEGGEIPMCQDTGIHLFYVSGKCDPSLKEKIKSGVARATQEIPLRPNLVHPLTRENPGNNLGEGMPPIHFSPTEDDFLEITVMPKGAGSENMSSLAMLTPSQGIKGIKSFVLDSVVRAGGNPCPPTIVGIGIGGSADLSCLLAKTALLRPLDQINEDATLRSLEEELKEMLNRTGIGPMGLGGRTTVLGVRINEAACHTASLPVAVNIQCWANRRASARIHPEGRVEFSQEGFE